MGWCIDTLDNLCPDPRQFRGGIPKTGCFRVPPPRLVPRSSLAVRVFFRRPPTSVSSTSTVPERSSGTSLARARRIRVRAPRTRFRPISLRTALFRARRAYCVPARHYDRNAPPLHRRLLFRRNHHEEAALAGPGSGLADRMIAALHATGGSVSATFDPNEQLVLSLVSRYGAEQFTLQDVQWTGWSHRKARRLLVGRVARGPVPGSPRRVAGTLRSRYHDEGRWGGRDAKRRQLVFLFDPEICRQTRVSGLVRLEGAKPENDHRDERWTGDEQSDGHVDGQPETDPAGSKSEKGLDAESSAQGCPSTRIMKTDHPAIKCSASRLRDLPHDGQLQ